MTIKVLATDLDGTLIPLAFNQENKTDLQVLQRELQRRNVSLVFVTGRSSALVQQAMREFDLPEPDWMICDVGTSIVRLTGDGTFESVNEYAAHLGQLTEHCPVSQLIYRLHDRPGLQLQEPEKQGPFKLSFYTDGSRLDEHSDALLRWIARNRLPYSLIASHDPETNHGLIDLLPAGVSKAYALNWWAVKQGFGNSEIIFAGDSGNDLAALTAGYRAIVVSNAHPKLAEEVQRLHEQRNLSGQLFRCKQPATSGVLEGLLHFLEGF